MTDKNKKPSGTQEWSDRSVNISSGCSHNCHYCYAKANSVRFKRNTPESWREEVVDPKKVVKNYKWVDTGARHDIMFPTSHDITPNILEECITTLRNILNNGNTVLIVSKPHLTCIKRICKEFVDFKDQITFRFSIGSTSDKVLKLWEPNAPRFRHRMKCLEFAFEQGFDTSVSCEPLLDGNATELVEAVLPFVTDTIWLGKPNNLVGAVSTNTGKDEDLKQRARELNAIMTLEYFQELFRVFGSNPTIRWKDSVKDMLGLERPDMRGQDV